MSGIVFDRDEVEVDAAIIAAGLRLEPERVQPLLRERRIASRIERGENDDAGRFRLTFVHDRRQLRLVVDDTGQILTMSATDLPARRRHASHRSRGARVP